MCNHIGSDDPTRQLTIELRRLKGGTYHIKGCPSYSAVQRRLHTIITIFAATLLSSSTDGDNSKNSILHLPSFLFMSVRALEFFCQLSKTDKDMNLTSALSRKRPSPFAGFRAPYRVALPLCEAQRVLLLRLSPKYLICRNRCLRQLV